MGFEHGILDRFLTFTDSWASKAGGVHIWEESIAQFNHFLVASLLLTQYTSPANVLQIVIAAAVLYGELLFAGRRSYTC